MKLILQRVHHAQITIPKGAETEAREFYCEFLGLPEVEKPDSLKGRGGFWLEIGAFQIHVGTEDAIERGKSKAHLAYQVNDLNGWRELLQTKNIEILAGVPIPGYDRFEFRDPFGNRVEFLQKI
jgi:catechol 2,3-dioxygenase-like lactoylglutathione lyase family enzyme